MSVCTFFGHRDCPEAIRAQVRQAVEELILHESADTFYVGDRGRFDTIVRGVLRELSAQYPHIRYAVVLAALPCGTEDPSDTMLPEGLETVPPRFAVDRRNEWMLKQADLVVTYVTHGWGGAAKFAEKAKKAGKRVIALP